jgi:hypothetical protein
MDLCKFVDSEEPEPFPDKRVSSGAKGGRRGVEEGSKGA